MRIVLLIPGYDAKMVLEWMLQDSDIQGSGKNIDGTTCLYWYSDGWIY